MEARVAARVAEARGVVARGVAATVVAREAALVRVEEGLEAAG